MDVEGDREGVARRGEAEKEGQTYVCTEWLTTASRLPTYVCVSSGGAAAVRGGGARQRQGSGKRATERGAW